MVETMYFGTPKGSAAHDLMKTWHFMLGLTVFALVLIRLPLRGALHAPPITPALPAWQNRLAHTLRWTLYGFLIVMPLLGWLTLSAKGQPIPFFGLELPALIGPDKATAKNLEDIHELIGTCKAWAPSSKANGDIDGYRDDSWPGHRRGDGGLYRPGVVGVQFSAQV